jgi:hypothetical protein
VLVGATVLQLAAQVAQAERTAWGVVLAAVPAITFLTLVKLTLARANGTAAEPLATRPEDAREPRTGEADRAREPRQTRERDHRSDYDGDELAVPTDAVTAQPASPDLDVGDLLLVGRAVVDDLAREGLPLNRRNLLAGVRARGRSCSTERAGALLKALRDPTGPLDERAV